MLFEHRGIGPLLGDPGLVSSFSNTNVLMFDLDAQMSLTQAIALNEATGKLHDKFGKWYGQAIAKRKTIFDALDQFTKPATHFDFAVGFDFIYKLSENLHFVPSVEDLYWMELEVFNRDGVKDFIRRLMGKIANSARVWLSYWTLTNQAARTGFRSGRSVSSIAGPHRSLRARARSCTMC